jgi:alkyldihydroxyacetonephosphate synthase
MPEDASVMGDRYLESWDRALTATAEAGGGIAHHHGSGRLRRDYLHHDLGESGLALLRKLKHAIDPQGILNPGNLLPVKDTD